MASEWTSPRQRTGANPPRQRVKQLKEKFETPQVRTGAQRKSPKREKVPELRKKFEHSNAGASGHLHRHSGTGPEQPHHDETQYVDILKTIVQHHQEDVASLQSEIQELEELVDDLSYDRLSVSGGSSGKDPSGRGMFTSTPEKKDIGNIYAPNAFTAQLATGGASTSRRGTYRKPPKHFYTGSEIDNIIEKVDYEDYYDSDFTDPWEQIPPGRDEQELEDDVFVPGVSPRAFKKQRPDIAAQREFVKYGRPHSELTEIMNYPDSIKKRQEKSEPTRKKEEKYPWPLRGVGRNDGIGPYIKGATGKGTYTAEPTGKGTYTARPTGKGTYTAGPSRKGTYAAGPSRKGTYAAGPSRKGTYAAGPARKGTYAPGPSRKGTYTAEPSRKGTYTAEPSRKGTYTAKPSRKGTYTAEPTRKGTYTATPSYKSAKNKPINDGTVKVDPHTPYISRALRLDPNANFFNNPTIQKTVTLYSPEKDDSQQFDVSVTTENISTSASGEHVVFGIGIEVEPEMPTRYYHHRTPPITPSRQRKASLSTPTSVFTTHHAAQRNLFDAERESPKYSSPKNTTIEWETPEETQNSPKNRTFEIKSNTAQMNKTFTTDQNSEFEDESFESPQQSSPQSNGNRTFEYSPQWKQKDGSTSPRHDRTFQESPQFAYGAHGGGHHDRTFEDSPQWKQKDSPHSPHHDRTFEDSPQWKQKDSSHSPHHDRTFQESPQHAYGAHRGGHHDRTFEDSPQWANRTHEVSEGELEQASESPQLNKTFDA